MNASVQRLGHLEIGVPLADQAAERRLDMPRRAAEAVVKIQMTECGIEVVAPEQINDAAAEPDAFGIGRGSAQYLGRLGKLIDFF